MSVLLLLPSFFFGLVYSNNDTDFTGNNIDGCDKYRMDFSLKSSDFIWCVDNYTVRPLSICRHCKDQYLEVQKSYTEWKMNSCKIDLGINLDPVHETYDFIGKERTFFELTSDEDVGRVGLWEQGFCSYCYTAPLTENSTLTEEVQVFTSLYKDVQDCFSQYQNSTKNKKICNKCSVNYANLVKYYTDTILNDNFEDFVGICFDIVDTMNFTQNQWGKVWKCGRQWKIDVGLIYSMSVVLILTLVFYLYVWVAPDNTITRERIVPQRTFMERMNIMSLPSLQRMISEEMTRIRTISETFLENFEDSDTEIVQNGDVQHM